MKIFQSLWHYENGGEVVWFLVADQRVTVKRVASESFSARQRAHKKMASLRQTGRTNGFILGRFDHGVKTV